MQRVLSLPADVDMTRMSRSSMLSLLLASSRATLLRFIFDMFVAILCGVVEEASVFRRLEQR